MYICLMKMADVTSPAPSREARGLGRGREAARGGNGRWRRPSAADNAVPRAPTPAGMTAADKAGVELFVSMILCCVPGQGVQLEPRWSEEGWGYAAGRFVERRAPWDRYPGACGEATAGDEWKARLVAIWGWLETVLPPDVDFKIAPWFARGGCVMFVLTARAAIVPQRQRATGGKSHGGKGARKSRSARRAAARATVAEPPPADVPADAASAGLICSAAYRPRGGRGNGCGSAAPAHATATAQFEAPRERRLSISRYAVADWWHGFGIEGTSGLGGSDERAAAAATGQ
jgi:hypothetical protein